MNTKITIVTVCFNAEADIERTMLSVLNQDYDNLEYVIVDGKSKDKTFLVVEEVKRRFPYRNVVILSEPDRGIFDAMNKGIRLAHGEWINFMNAGDVFYDNTVVSNLFCADYPDTVGVVYGDTYNGTGIFPMIPFTRHPDRFCEMGICHQSLFARTTLAKKYPFDLNFKVAADYNMVRHIFDDGYELRYVATPVSVYDMNGFSTQNVMRQMDEVAMICHKYKSFAHYRVKTVKYIKNLIKNIIKK